MIITYSDDTAALLAEVEQKAQDYIVRDEDGQAIAIGPLLKTPTKRVGSETVAVCGHLPDELMGLDHLRVLGTVKQVGGEWVPDLIGSAEQTIYARVWPTAPVKMTDEDGNEYTHTPPAVPGIL